MVDHGDSWRVGVANASRAANVMRLGFGSGGGGGPFGWGGGSSGGASIGPWFRAAQGTLPELFTVSCRGGDAFVNGTRLPQDAPAEMTFHDDVPSDAGVLQLTRVVSVTYVGKLHVIEEPVDSACARGLD